MLAKVEAPKQKRHILEARPRNAIAHVCTDDATGRRASIVRHLANQDDSLSGCNQACARLGQGSLKHAARSVPRVSRTRLVEQEMFSAELDSIGLSRFGP